MKARRRRQINLGKVTKQDFIVIAKILSSECAPKSVTNRLADYFGERFLKAASCMR